MRDATTLTVGEQLTVALKHSVYAKGTFAGFDGTDVIVDRSWVSSRVNLRDPQIVVTDAHGRVVGLPDSDPPIGEGAPPPDLE